MDSRVYLWIIVFTFYGAAAGHLAFHWYSLKDMEPADYMIRGTLFFLYLLIATTHLAAIVGFDSIWRRVAFSVFGCALVTGYTILLWKYRSDRKVAVYLTALKK